MIEKKLFSKTKYKQMKVMKPVNNKQISPCGFWE